MLSARTPNRKVIAISDPSVIDYAGGVRMATGSRRTYVRG